MPNHEIVFRKHFTLFRKEFIDSALYFDGFKLPVRFAPLYFDAFLLPVWLTPLYFDAFLLPVRLAPLYFKNVKKRVRNIKI